MTGGGTPGKRPPAKPADSAPRHVYGPRPVGALVPTLTRPAFRKRAPGSAQVMADWAEIVGPELSRTTVPRRISGSTLTLACTGPVALELQHLSEQVLARVNSHLGRVAVQRLRFVQDPAAMPAPPPTAPRPAMKRIELPGIPPGPLHDALVALGRRIGQGEPG